MAELVIGFSLDFHLAAMPLGDGDVVLLKIDKSATPERVEELMQNMGHALSASGRSGLTVLVTIDPVLSVETWDEAAMNNLGWFRHSDDERGEYRF